MSNQELQELLIKKIRQTDDHVLLEEVTRLLDIEIDDATFMYFQHQKNLI